MCAAGEDPSPLDASHRGGVPVARLVEHAERGVPDEALAACGEYVVELELRVEELGHEADGARRVGHRAAPLARLQQRSVRVAVGREACGARALDCALRLRQVATTRPRRRHRVVAHERRLRATLLRERSEQALVKSCRKTKQKWWGRYSVV